jgi:hypothetical protein
LAVVTLIVCVAKRSPSKTFTVKLSGPVYPVIGT